MHFFLQHETRDPDATYLRVVELEWVFYSDRPSKSVDPSEFCGLYLFPKRGFVEGKLNYCHYC